MARTAKANAALAVHLMAEQEESIVPAVALLAHMPAASREVTSRLGAVDMETHQLLKDLHQEQEKTLEHMKKRFREAKLPEDLDNIEPEGALERIKEKRQRVEEAMGRKQQLINSAYDLMDSAFKTVDKVIVALQQDVQATAAAAVLPLEGAAALDATDEAYVDNSDDDFSLNAPSTAPRTRRGKNAAAIAAAAIATGAPASSTRLSTRVTSRGSGGGGAAGVAAEAAGSFLTHVAAAAPVGPPLPSSVDPNEPVYCVCQRVSYGEMVACENEDCDLEWFHYACVGLTAAPEGAWYCPVCRPTFQPELVEQERQEEEKRKEDEAQEAAMVVAAAAEAAAPAAAAAAAAAVAEDAAAGGEGAAVEERTAEETEAAPAAGEGAERDSDAAVGSSDADHGSVQPPAGA